MFTWRPATPRDDEAIVAMSLALYAAEPGRMTEAKVRRTLATFRDEPVRGRVLVLDANGVCAGYALLVAFWSNELGGEICTIDELYVAPAFRGQGHSTRLVQGLQVGAAPWPRVPVALELEVAPENGRAFALYRRLGFAIKHNTTLRLSPAESMPPLFVDPA